MTILSELYDKHGCHFSEEKDGKHSIIFLYRPPAPSANLEVTLNCPDLYEWMLAEDADSNMYSLSIDNIPTEIFATYDIKVNGVVSPPPPSQKLLPMHRLELDTGKPYSFTPIKLELFRAKDNQLIDVDDSRIDNVLQVANYPRRHDSLENYPSQRVIVKLSIPTDIKKLNDVEKQINLESY